MTPPSHGSASVNPNGTVTYTPVAGFNGSDSFTYSISDSQGGSATGTVNVTISSVNEAPVAVNDSYSTNKNTALQLVAPGVLSNDTDGDGDQLMASVMASPAHGDLTLNSDGGLTYTPDAGYTGLDSVHVYRRRRDRNVERGDRDDHGHRDERTAGRGEQQLQHE